MHGMQITVGANRVREVGHGLQVAAGANLVGRRLWGLQVGAGFNGVDGVMHGLQVAARRQPGRAGRSTGCRWGPSPTSPAGTCGDCRSASPTMSRGNARGAQVGLVER